MTTLDYLQKWYAYDPVSGIVYSRLRTNSRRVHEPKPVKSKDLKVNGAWMALATIAWSLYNERLPRPGYEIDHADRDTDNNKIENLREATHSQNDQNRVRPAPQSGFKGVTNTRGRWQARITYDGSTHHLGMFGTPEEAHAAYCEAAEKYHGEFMNVESHT